MLELAGGIGDVGGLPPIALVAAVFVLAALARLIFVGGGDE